nr:hypothetical protein [Halomarina sp. PSRA2]
MSDVHIRDGDHRHPEGVRANVRGDVSDDTVVFQSGQSIVDRRLPQTEPISESLEVLVVVPLYLAEDVDILSSRSGGRRRLSWRSVLASA